MRINNVAILSVFSITVFAIIGAVNADEQTWKLDAITAALRGGTLTVSGNGQMSDYIDEAPPWSNVTGAITDIVIENGVRSIGNFAFSNCTSLTSVTIPNSVRIIGKGVFTGSKNLKSVTIPASVGFIANLALNGCENLMSIEVATDNVKYSSANGVLFNKNKTTLIQYPSGKRDSAYHIPNSVTEIKMSAFCCSKNLKYVTIPNSVKKIDAYAFEFSGLITVTIPNSITEIGDLTFRSCKNLVSVTLPNSVTMIGGNAFDGSGLASVTIPNSIKTIGADAFHGTNLTSVTIPSSVISIRTRTFSSCTSLTSVTIPNSVTSIGTEAFAGCKKLMSVTSLNPVPPVLEIEKFRENAFHNIPDEACLYVPASGIGQYREAYGWKNFKCIKAYQ